MATFDISNHALLTETSLSVETLEAHTLIAEQLLGLAGANLTGDDLEAAKAALALQVNYQVDVLPDRDWDTISEEDPFEYLNRSAKEYIGVNPVAARMVRALMGQSQAAAVVSVPVSAPLTIPDLTGEAAAPFSFDIT